MRARCLFRTDGFRIGDRVIAAKLNEALIEGVSDEVMVVGAGGQYSIQVGLELEGGAHAAEFEVAQPKLAVREPRFLAVGVKDVNRRLTHRGRIRAQVRVHEQTGSLFEPVGEVVPRDKARGVGDQKKPLPRRPLRAP